MSTIVQTIGGSSGSTGSGGNSGYLNAVTDFGAVGDGTTNNNAALDNAVAAALTQKKALYLPAGRYMRTTTWNCRGRNLHLFGDGAENSVILEGMGNAPTLQVGGYYQWVHDIGTELASTKGPNSNAIEFLDCAYSTYERLTLIGPGRGLYQPQTAADGSGNGLWSCMLSTIRISGASIAAINLSGYNTANTGSVFNNIYIGGLSVDATPTEAQVVFKNFDEMVVNQLNIEHCDLTMHALQFETCMSATVNGLHFENVSLDGSSRAFVSCVNQVKLNLNSVTLAACHFPTGSGDKAFLSYDVNPSHVRVHGLHSSMATVAATNRYLVLAVDNAGTVGSSITITGAKLGSDFTANSGGDSTTIPQLKRVNDSLFHYQENGKNVTFGTAAPTTGTWAVGDKRWNSAPAAGGTPGWVCTTAGTPGTWRTMANLA